MSTLIAKIDRAKKMATFSGPGTFAAKDKIKELGSARWMSADKVWQVKPFELSNSELEERFPEVVIEEASASEAQEPSAPPTPLVKPAPEKLDATLPASCSVVELIGEIQGALQRAFPKEICVRGVLVSAKHYSPRVYMELAEQDNPDERIDCVIWDEKAVCKELYKAGFSLEADLQVMFRVKVGLNRRRSSVSLSVVGIVHEYTLAKVAALRDITNKRLQKEGLFAKNKELSLPFLPRKLGVLTSSGGTVINDFRASLDEANFGFELFWRSVSVQGSSAVPSLVKGLQLLGKRKDLDAILLFRGGGSAAELAVFSEYEVAKAICLSPLPVVSAIGHQEDQSSTQDVSCVALGVPKDIGRYFADIVLDLRGRLAEAMEYIADESEGLVDLAEERLSAFSALLKTAVSHLVHGKEEHFVRLRSSLPVLTGAALERALIRLQDRVMPVQALARKSLEYQQMQIRSVVQSISTRLGHVAEQSLMRVAAFEQRIRDAGPDVQLKRGFTLVRIKGEEGYATSSEALKISDAVEISFHDQTREATITK